mmetsp:Transcript_58546/g.139354  ORF Transcript_58546/g.139354 Transcript_58546/m.139354 type:complete len:204 (-) Transcript_58546:1618-2229(-)
MEGVLRHIGQAQSLGLPNGALGGQLLAHQHLDGCGLARAVGTDDGDTAHLTHGEADVHDGGLVLGGVGEAHGVHPQNHLGAALHALQGSGLREGELHDVIADLEVGLLLGVLLHELGEALALLALEGLQLSVLEVDDVGAHLVQEGAEVGGADDAAIEGLQPVFQPLDVVDVQMSSRLIQHEHVSVHQLRSAELHLHLPAAGV